MRHEVLPSRTSSITKRVPTSSDGHLVSMETSQTVLDQYNRSTSAQSPDLNSPEVVHRQGPGPGSGLGPGSGSEEAAGVCAAAAGSSELKLLTGISCGT